MRPTLDEALEYVVDDELVEVRVGLSCFICQAASICAATFFQLGLIQALYILPFKHACFVCCRLHHRV